MNRRSFTKLGYTVTPSQTNFVMMDLRRPVQPVIEACQRAGILIGRPFPPLTNWVRVSIGTMDEMRRGVDVLQTALSSPVTTQR